jgi:hypothetical protein
VQAVEKVSLACKGLCMWVGAMEVYGNTVREVAPRRAKAAAAQQLLAKKEAALAESQLHLAEVLKKVEGLKVPTSACTHRALPNGQIVHVPRLMMEKTETK